MTDRTVRVRLQAAVQGYQAAMARASASTKEFGREVGQTSRMSKQEMQTVGTAFAVTGGAIAAGFVIAGKATMDFDKQMSAVGAVADATSGDLDRLRQAALKAGADTAFSATEAAQAEEELVKAGISVSDVLGGALDGALSLAAAGQLDLGEAAEIAAQQMNIFGMEGKDVSHIADVLAAGANKSAADVGDLGAAMRQGGLVAAQTGLTFEETAAALSLFADNALVGADAGTSLKSMLQRLTPQSKEAAGLMDELGFSAYDAQGNFVGLAELSNELQTSLGGMTVEQRNAAMATLFGSDAVRGANVLYEAGADVVDEYTAAVDDQGAAAEVAAARLDNLAGDLEELGGSIETALISTGSMGTGVLRGLVQGVTDVVNVYNDLPGPAQAAATGVAATAGAASLAAGGFLLAAPRIVETKDAFKALSVTMPRATGALKGVSSLLMGPVGIALGAAVVGVGLFAKAKANATRKVEEFADTLDQETGAITENTRAHALARMEQEGLIEAADTLGISLQDLTDAALGDEAAWRRVQAATDAANESLKGTGEEMVYDVKRKADVEGATRHLTTAMGGLNRDLAKSQEEFRKSSEDAAEAEGKYFDVAHAIRDGLDPATASMIVRAQEQAAAQDDAAGSAADLGGEMDDLTGEVEETVSALEAYIDVSKRSADPVYALNSALQDVEDAQTAYTEAIDKHGGSSAEARQAALDLTSAVASAEAAAIDGDLSFDAFSDKLNQWVAMGVITADQANVTRERVAELRGEAERYEGGYTASIGLSGYGTTLQQLRDLALAADRVGDDIHVSVTGTTVGGRTRHSGGRVDDTGPWRSAMDLQPRERLVVAEVGEQVVTARDWAALMTMVPRYHDGGAVGPVSSAGAVFASASNGLGALTEAQPRRATGRTMMAAPINYGGSVGSVSIGDLRIEAPPGGTAAEYEQVARRVVAGALRGIHDQYLAGA